MDNDREYTDEEFRKTIVELVKDKNLLGENGRLSDDQMARQDKNVYAHIARSLDTESTSSEKIADNKNQPTGLENFRDWLFGGFGKVAFAACAIACVGAITIVSMGTNKDSALPELPQTLALAELDQHVIPSSGAALVSRELTERREAFLVGVARATVDVSSKNAEEIITDDFRQYIAGDSTDKSSMVWLAERVSKLNTTSSREWMILGYTTEILSLNAKLSLEKMDLSLIAEAVRFYQAENHELREDKESAKQYLDNHNYLMNLNPDTINSPDAIQEIIDRTRNTKVAIE